jgi:hypothetical protein
MLMKTSRVAASIALAAAALACGAAVHAAEAPKRLRFAASCREIPSRVERQVAVPRFYHEGLYFDGKSLWLCNGEGGMIWVIDPDTGEVRSEVRPVSCFTEAVTARGDGAFYTTEWYDKKVYRVRVESDALKAEACASVDPSHPAGAVWAGDRLYVVTWDRGITGTKFGILEMGADLGVAGRIQVKDIQEPCQLAWDGTFLWMTSWYEKRIYKIDVRLWEVVGYFCSPVKKTTGIAWDGKGLWVTGTHEHLYRVSLGE